MSVRRFGRARKAVDYAKFGDREDFDDDFTDSTPPASKKPRLSNKEIKEKNTVYRVENQIKQKSSSNRKSVEERRYERELQEALMLSMSQSDPSQGSTFSPNETDNKEAQPVVNEDEEQTVPSPILPAIDNPPVLTKAMEGENDIKETSIEQVPSSQRRARKTKKYIYSDSESGGEGICTEMKQWNEDGKSIIVPSVKRPNMMPQELDSDFAPDIGDHNDSFDEDDSDDEDDYNPEDSDSDFGSSKKKKPTKKTAVKPNVSKGATNKPNVVKTSIGKSSAAKSVKTTGTLKSGIAPKPLAASSLSSRTPGSGLTDQRPPNWKPPGLGIERKSAAGLNAKTKNVIESPSVGINSKTKPSLSGGLGKSPLGGVNIKSPSSGLRLGLSRNMKLKPLHPNLKVHN